MIKPGSQYARYMDSLSGLARDLVQLAYQIDMDLAEKHVKLPPAAAEDLRASLTEIRSQLLSYHQQLRERFVERYIEVGLVSQAVHPYRADVVVPLEDGGFLAFAEVAEGELGLPLSGGDEPVSAENEVPVSVYIDSDDEDEIASVIEAVKELTHALGYEEVGEPDIRRGSFWRRSRAVAATGMDELKSRLMKVERGLELAQLDLRQAEVNVKESEAVSKLLSALEGTERVCILVGSVFLVKYVVNGQQVVVVRNLTQLEMHALTKFPEIQTRPEEALQALAIAIASTPALEGNGDDAIPEGAS